MYFIFEERNFDSLLLTSNKKFLKIILKFLLLPSEYKLVDYSSLSELEYQYMNTTLVSKLIFHPCFCLFWTLQAHIAASNNMWLILSANMIALLFMVYVDKRLFGYINIMQPFWNHLFARNATKDIYRFWTLRV